MKRIIDGGAFIDMWQMLTDAEGDVPASPVCCAFAARALDAILRDEWLVWGYEADSWGPSGRRCPCNNSQLALIIAETLVLVTKSDTITENVCRTACDWIWFRRSDLEKPCSLAHPHWNVSISDKHYTSGFGSLCMVYFAERLVELPLAKRDGIELTIGCLALELLARLNLPLALYTLYRQDDLQESFLADVDAIDGWLKRYGTHNFDYATWVWNRVGPYL